MDATGLRQVKDLKELAGVYNSDKVIAERVSTAKALKNVKKPLVCVADSGAINKKQADVRVQKALRENRNPHVLANVRDKLEHIDQELLYANYDAAVERIIETLKYLEHGAN